MTILNMNLMQYQGRTLYISLVAIGESSGFHPKDIQNKIMEIIVEKAEFLCKDTMEYTFSPS